MTNVLGVFLTTSMILMKVVMTDVINEIETHRRNTRFMCFITVVLVTFLNIAKEAKSGDKSGHVTRIQI